jgi:hypothetical protein
MAAQLARWITSSALQSKKAMTMSLLTNEVPCTRNKRADARRFGQPQKEKAAHAIFSFASRKNYGVSRPACSSRLPRAPQASGLHIEAA